MTEESNYQSFEEKYLSKFGEYGIGFYGAVASFFRIPTTVRKFKKRQLLYQKLECKSASSDAMFAGVFTGLAADLGLAICFNFFEELFYTWLGTNLTSGIYELRRRAKKDKSKLEDRALDSNH